MQLAGSFFLDRNQRTWSRKLPEIAMALILEQRLTKQQIFTMYANEMYLGHRGSFAINGFGEAARAYFEKDVDDLTLGEAATLVGMLPAPNARAPHDNPLNARAHRDRVLEAMYERDMIGPDQLADARGAEIMVADVTIDQNDAPYMVDYIREQLLEDFNEQDLLNGGLNIYTTLDPDLQRAAFNAVAAGIANVDEQLEARGRGVSSGRPPVQASLIALDPHTGEIRAMVGGRDYGTSQYNRITEAFRQPGSIFKPFVYAAAFETAFEPLERAATPIATSARANPLADQFPALFGLEPAIPDRPISGTELDQVASREARARTREEARRQRLRDADQTPNDADGLIFDLNIDTIGDRNERGSIQTDTIITPLTTVVDEPTYFFYGENYYRPDNFGDVFAGLITAREALQRSLNVPTVKVAERVGYDRVASLVYRAGFNADIQPYPSIALGSFEVTPIEIAGAWTAFANGGVRAEPRALSGVSTNEGETLRTYPIESTEVFRPELAALMTNLLENVINAGTGVGVRSRGYTRPAAGKTGTSRDGWFAGYTTDLLVIAWVGFDDNRELDIEGSRSALPIWTSFMLEASRLYPARPEQDVAFAVPPGVEMATIDGETLTLASPTCDLRFVQAFIRGTAPTAFCPIHAFGDGFLLSGVPAVSAPVLSNTSP
jgi:membrane peptidoglycan carboxypeptidase